MGIQILVTLVSAFIVIKALKSARQKNVSYGMAALWSFFWLVVIFLVWQPQITDRLAGLLKVGRGADAIFYLALVFIFYLFFRLFTMIEKLDQELTTLIREIAILEKETRDRTHKLF